MEVKVNKKKNFLWTLLSRFSLRIIQTAISIIILPISLSYWDVDRYGLWAVINSIIVYLSMSNLGLTGAATTLMAKEPDLRAKFFILKRVALMLIAIVIASFVVFIALNVFFPSWIRLLGKIPPKLTREAFFTTILVGSFFFINLPFALVNSVLVSIQKAYIESICNGIETVATLFNLLITIHFKGNLVLFATVMGATKLTIGLFKLLYAYLFVYKKLNFDNFSREKFIETEEYYYKDIFTLGLRFFSLGLAAMVVWNTDNLVISNFLNVASVTPYSITFKVYRIVFDIIFIASGSILPVLAMEFGKKNWEWISRMYSTFQHLMLYIGGLTWVAGVALFKYIILIWVGKKGFAGFGVLVFLGGYSFLLPTISLYASIIQTFNYLKGTVWIGWLEAIVNITISIVLVHYFGLMGAAIGTFIGALVGPALFLPNAISKKSGNKLNSNTFAIIKYFTIIVLPCLIVIFWVQNYIQNINIQILIGIVVTIVYMIIGYLYIPKATKLYILGHLPFIKGRVS